MLFLWQCLKFHIISKIAYHLYIAVYQAFAKGALRMKAAISLRSAELRKALKYESNKLRKRLSGALKE